MEAQEMSGDARANSKCSLSREWTEREIESIYDQALKRPQVTHELIIQSMMKALPEERWKKRISFAMLDTIKREIEYRMNREDEEDLRKEVNELRQVVIRKSQEIKPIVCVLGLNSQEKIRLRQVCYKHANIIHKSMEKMDLKIEREGDLFDLAYEIVIFARRFRNAH